MGENNSIPHHKYDQYIKLLDELDELLSFSPARSWRRNIEHLFFSFLEDNENFQGADHKELVGQISRLINFFDLAEETTG